MANILPFYLVCDESYSMEGEPIDSMNKALPELHMEIGINPVVCDKVRFSIITFSEQPQVLQPLVDLSQVTQLPELHPRGGTSYAPAFRLLRTEIDHDVDELKTQGHRVYRPSVFFLSDGQPTDEDADWQQALADLVDPNWGRHPNVLAFGFGAANEKVIARVGVTRAFMADGSISPAKALAEFAKSLTRSIVQSASGAGDGVAPVIPNQVKGFAPLPADPII
ncbi:MAG: VWA domain-containing protein [Micropruina sp.]|uniref:vWA domain-containing protein n=1 Tax=Micropruina sp. TaxID=2737536 RepID=UPI0039E62242